MKKRQEIDLKSEPLPVFHLMAESNPGALDILTQLMQRKTEDHREPYLLILAMDDMNIRGTQIVIAYLDYCGGDLEKFVAAVKTRDRKMVDFINKLAKKMDLGHKAVVREAIINDREYL